jgi:FemAB-related protein (PEP-CTERM system-associated)
LSTVVVELTPARETAWSAYVAEHPQGTLFHDLVWRALLQRTFKHRCTYLLAMRKEAVVGVVPLVLIKSMFFGRSVVSVPFGVYGGVLADDAEATGALLRAAEEVAADARADYVELRHLHAPPGCELAESGSHSTFIRDLPLCGDEVLNMIPRKARAEARKARAAGTVTLGQEPPSISAFHALFAENKRKLGSPVFPQSMFWHLRDLLGERFHLLAVEREGRPVAALMSFLWRGDWMAYYSGATDEANRLSANNLMYLCAMEEAVKRGMKRFDFGRSRNGTGAFSFKVNQGFEPSPLHYQFITARGKPVPAVNAGNPRYDFAKRVFKSLPMCAASRLGSFVVKRMPV